MSTERPILFSGPMVRAILEGRKTQTRRIVKPQWSADVDEVSERPALDPFLKCVVSGHSGEWEDDHGLDERRRCPYGKPGDRLWVKETWNKADPEGEDAIAGETYGPFSPLPGVCGSRTIRWRAVYAATSSGSHPKFGKAIWRPSIHMPRWACRITLEVTAVRVERLNEISEADAKAEGTTPSITGEDSNRFRAGYMTLWESINGSGSWAANPWVWVVEFRRVEEASK